jgi:phage shock protein C
MSTAAMNDHQASEFASGEEDRTALPLRPDTFLGVCEAIGQDLGINPNWLRIAFAPVILVSPMAAIGAYLALGIMVALSRWLFPAEHKAAAAKLEAVASNEAPASVENVESEEKELLAA